MTGEEEINWISTLSAFGMALLFASIVATILKMALKRDLVHYEKV